MLSFENDYSEGAHEKILTRLWETNYNRQSGYGADQYCQAAIEKIKSACQCPQADVHFLVGGTQTNMIVISAMLKSYEGVIAVQTGHINVHEAGAVEHTGHKVLTLPEHQGKMDPAELEQYLTTFWQDETHDHMVFPGMVYLSHPTEYGTLYSKAELSAISDLCHRFHLPLFLDGARLGYGLMSKDTDLTLPLIAQYCDVFYIGGTKVGALCGEAVVFTKQNTPPHFSTIIKQHGGMLAKGRLLGVQFDTLFTDNLYFTISAHAIEMAEQLKQLLHQKGYSFYLESPTNQQFIILSDEQYASLRQKVKMSYWGKLDTTHTIVRFATSWATTEADLLALAEIL